MFRNLTANLIAHEQIETTDAKAKELRRVAERLITKAVRLGREAYEKPGDGADKARIARRLHVARQIGSFIPRFSVVKDSDGDFVQVDLVEKVLIDLARRYQGRPGGYTRIVKLGPRRGDNAPMSMIELLDGDMDPLGSDTSYGEMEDDDSDFVDTTGVEVDAGDAESAEAAETAAVTEEAEPAGAEAAEVPVEEVAVEEVAVEEVAGEVKVSETAVVEGEPKTEG